MFWFLPILLGSALVGAAAGAAVAVIGNIIDGDSIKEELNSQQEFKDAFKAIIKSKSTRKVNVGIFDNQEVNIGSCEITSDKGVSPNLYVGQVIYL